MPDDVLNDVLKDNDVRTPGEIHRTEQYAPSDPPRPAPDEAPFVVEHRQEERTPRGYFRPASRLILTPALRTGGLWAALPPEDFKTLILMLRS